MLKDIDKLSESFLDTIKKSKEKCGSKLEGIRQLTYIIQTLYESFIESLTPDKEYSARVFNSLGLMCFMELLRISGHILFLSACGLYRNAFDNIRYALESIVQALYIDNRHPETPLDIKIEILKEVEDKREYHAVRLLDELRIEHKDKLKREYKELSRIIHPSHRQIIATLGDLEEGRGVPVTIDCEEISRIYDSMIRMYDIFFFLFITYFPEVKDALKKNLEFIKYIKAYNLTLLAKALNVRL